MSELLILNLRDHDSSMKVGVGRWSRRDPQTGLIRSCSAEEAKAVCEGKKICALVHGYHCPEPDGAYGRLGEVAECWYSAIIEVEWPGGSLAAAFLPSWLRWISRNDVFDRANRSGVALFRNLEPLCAAKIDIQTHSLGARVGLTAAAQGLLIRNLILSAPAVPCDALASEFAEAAGSCQRILIACSRNDSVLKYAYPASSLGAALGYAGPTPPIPTNCHTMHCDAFVHKHGDYKRCEAYLQWWRLAAL